MTQENAHTSGEEFISPAEEKKKLKKPVPVGKIICYVMLALYALWLIFPLYTIIATSFTSTEQFTSTLEFVWLPKLTVEPYAKVFSKDVYAMTTGIPSMLLGFINTMWITLVPLIIGLLVSGLSAYAFSKIKFKGKKTLFALSVLTMSFPVGAFTVISYMFYEILGWVGTPLPLIIPGMFGTVNMMFFLRMYFEDESYYEKEWVNNPDLPTQDNPKDYKELIGTWETESEYYEQSSLVIYDIDENEMRFSLYNYTENGDCVDNVTLDISEKQYTEWEPNRKFAACDNNGNEIGTFIIPANSTGVADTITFQTGTWTAVFEKVSDDTNEENTSQYDEAVGDWKYTKYAEDMPGDILYSEVAVHVYYIENNLITFDVSKYIWNKGISVHTNIITALLENGVAEFSFFNEYGNEGTGNIKLGTENIEVELVTTVEAEEETLSMDLNQTLTRESALDDSQDNIENVYENTVDAADDYIFPESSYTYLDEVLLYNYTPDELMLGRNEIYARHGRIFDDPEIQAYFEGKSWYEGTITGDEFDSQVDLIFNEYEKENVEIIRQVEEMMRQGII